MWFECLFWLTFEWLIPVCSMVLAYLPPKQRVIYRVNAGKSSNARRIWEKQWQLEMTEMTDILRKWLKWWKWRKWHRNDGRKLMLSWMGKNKSIDGIFWELRAEEMALRLRLEPEGGCGGPGGVFRAWLWVETWVRIGLVGFFFGSCSG